MSTKKHDSPTIILIRKVLDDPNMTLPSKSNRYIFTLQQRLKNQPRISYKSTLSPHLQPSVQIHQAEKDVHTTEISSHDQSVSPQQSDSMDQGYFKKGEDLFEIEHVSDQVIPEFIEVKPKDQITPISDEKTVQAPIQDEERIKELPKWELVDEEDEVASEKQPIVDKRDTEMQWQEAETESSETEETMIWEPAEEEQQQDKPEKRPLFKKFSRQKQSFEPADEEPKFKVAELKTSIKKLKQKNGSTVFEYKGYTLYQKEMDLGNNKTRVIHFFSKDTPDDSIPSPLPDNYEVRINKKTGVPYIRKKDS